MKVKENIAALLAGATVAICAQTVVAGTDVYFNPLTQSSAVASPNHINELTQPWVAPAGIDQYNLTSMAEIEGDLTQSVVRTGTGTGQSMFDMIAFDPSGKYLFIPHETFSGAGVSRYSIEDDTNVVLFAGDEQGPNGDWSNDWGAFDPARFTPNGTVWLGEEWSGLGRVMELVNPFADPADIEIREVHSIANVSHEGIFFSKKFKDTIYYVDENNSGSVYKFVMSKKGDYSKGQTFVLSVNDFTGDVSANWNETDSARTGPAIWLALTNKDGVALTETNPFAAGQANGRAATDEVGGTPYGRPEDTEVGTLANGNEVLYFTATSEQAVYSVEILRGNKAIVREFASETSTPKNMGFPATTGIVNSPDNLAQDALGNIYIIEDAPNGSDVGGDIWFVRDIDGDGEAESIYHFLSIQADGAEATGMIFNPTDPTQFVVAVQHPDSTDLTNVPDGFGDAIWAFDLDEVVPPTCEKGSGWNQYYDYRHRKHIRTCSTNYDVNFVKELKKSAYKKNKRWKHWRQVLILKYS